MDKFVHIHNHTEYSLLDGANRIPDMVRRAAEMEMEALAITDHGVMFGVMEFQMECQKKGIKPLLGVEAYVAPGGIHNKNGKEDKQAYHLLLLAKDLEGYRNLCKLSTIAALEGYYYKPRMDHELLREYSKGIVATSACLGSEVCQFLLNGDYDAAQRTAGLYDEIFGHGNFFIELQDHRLPEQAQIKDGLLRISRELKLPLIATNDAHYLCKGDATSHEVLLCIQTGRQMTDTNRMRFETEEFYLKSSEEMEALFADTPEALENSRMIAEMCNVELGKQRADMPTPDLPDGYSVNQYLRELAETAIPKRVKGNHDEALARLNYELGIIENTGYSNYFLLVREFAEETRRRGIYFGVRGSAAGSLVSYLVGITDVDPLEYDLTFERFLNPERVSMPDIDMDFEDARRDEIIEFVTEKYGSDRVAQIITFGTMAAKAAIKDCGRATGYTPQETDRICKTIPNVVGMTIDKAIKEVSEFRTMFESEPRVKELVTMAKQMEGRARHAGVHAAGVVISHDPLVNYVPLYRSNEGLPVTAFEMGILEKIGLLKMDFLGLSNLTVLSKAVKHIEKEHGVKVDVGTIEDGDEKTYNMLDRGETIGVFQLEGGGMTRYLVQLKPRSIRELAAMVALYRPGPMEHIPRFIDTKFERREAKYQDERMRTTLEETYGVIVYQDQVLKLVQALAGFTLGKADILRRAMGKKDAKAMADMKVEFMSGTAANDIPKKNAEEIWDLLLPFAGYAFNKAHAVCYAILAYQTAWLKANYTVEYMAALLAVYRSKEDRVIAFIEECRRLKIPVLPPDLNQSDLDFTIENRAIRFGLAAIKGVGDGLVEAILADKAENGPYIHLYEFCERLKPAGINRTAVESLIKSGALDGIDLNRNRLLDVVDGALAFADSALRSKLAGQDSLFGEGAEEEMISYPRLDHHVVEPTRHEKLAMEKEVLGIYVSDHPLRGHEKAIYEASTHGCADIASLDEGTPVRLSGVIATLKTQLTKGGEKFARLTLEDFTGQCGIIVSPKAYARINHLIHKDELVTIKGHVSVWERQGETLIEVRLGDVFPLEPTLDLQPREGSGESEALGKARVIVHSATPTQIGLLRTILAQFPGSYDAELVPGIGGNPFPLPWTIDPSESLLGELKKAIGNAELDVRVYSKGEPVPV